MLINESNLLDDIVYGLLKICDMFPEVFGILVNVCVGLPLDLKTSGDLLLGLDTNLSNQLRKLRNNPAFSALHLLKPEPISTLNSMPKLRPFVDSEELRRRDMVNTEARATIGIELTRNSSKR